MSAKICIYKSTADGEQVNVEINPDKGELAKLQLGARARAVYAPYFQLVDDRLLEMNLRIMVINKAVKELAPELQVAFHQLMASLHGQQPTDPSFRAILKDAIAEVSAQLMSQGVPLDKINGAIEATYGDLGDMAPRSLSIAKQEAESD